MTGHVFDKIMVLVVEFCKCRPSEKLFGGIFDIFYPPNLQVWWHTGNEARYMYSTGTWRAPIGLKGPVIGLYLKKDKR